MTWNYLNFMNSFLFFYHYMLSNRIKCGYLVDNFNYKQKCFSIKDGSHFILLNESTQYHSLIKFNRFFSFDALNSGKSTEKAQDNIRTNKRPSKNSRDEGQKNLDISNQVEAQKGRKYQSRNKNHPSKSFADEKNSNNNNISDIINLNFNEKYPIIDIGANLCGSRFKDIEDVLLRSKKFNVHKIIITGTSIKSSEQSIDLIRRFSHECMEKEQFSLYSTCGIHPHDAKTFSGDVTSNKILEICNDKNIVAVGECGLDFDRNFSSPEDQERCFIAQIKIAEKVGKPLFLHERAAFQKVVELLETYRHPTTKAVIHCFTGEKEELEKYISMGLYIGITGWITESERGRNLREIIKLVPLDRLMIETDCPYLTPRNIYDPSKQKYIKINRNEPVLLHFVLKQIAEILGKTTEELAKITTKNANEFFGLK